MESLSKLWAKCAEGRKAWRYGMGTMWFLQQTEYSTRQGVPPFQVIRRTDAVQTVLWGDSG
ncbi:hypothetical protein GCM10007972_06260 [Iodidimonas muriae]|uniref:Uncharacterized protein n=1 Tax=Iodidimonas muriae TaxID=261467 RepID=A0ABQ2L8Z5_9PROT|nr:hypothetical protein JCM17843_01710 [Kordiimonadales bacterium JCM 17843]GGO07180.1 hypothetical protein GCM10007972_06260 [Iodidimonas muriae]